MAYTQAGRTALASAGGSGCPAAARRRQDPPPVCRRPALRSGPVILSQWDWDQAVRLAPWKDVLTFLAWPVLSAQPYVYQSESDLHRLMQAAWSAAGVPVSHEVSLGRGLRIDFTGRGVGVEVKVAGHPVEVRRQMQRYAASGRLQALVLFTSCPSHRGEISEHGYGIPTAVIDLWAARSLVACPRVRR